MTMMMSCTTTTTTTTTAAATAAAAAAATTTLGTGNCLTSPLFRSYFWLFQVPKENLWELLQQVFTEKISMLSPT